MHTWIEYIRWCKHFVQVSWSVLFVCVHCVLLCESVFKRDIWRLSVVSMMASDVGAKNWSVLLCMLVCGQPEPPNQQIFMSRFCTWRLCISMFYIYVHIYMCVPLCCTVFDSWWWFVFNNVTQQVVKNEWQYESQALKLSGADLFVWHQSWILYPIISIPMAGTNQR